MWRRLPPPPSLQYVVVSAATDSSATAAMSRPQFRGGGGRGQWRGGFSYRPYSSSSDGGGRGGPCVTGDSSLRSVRDANTGFRRGETGTVPNQTGYHAVPPPPPQFNHNNHFRRPPPLDHNQPYRHSQQFQPHQQFRPNQQFQPRQLFRPAQQHRPQPQKPSDYRNWEYAKTTLPPNSEKFVVLSYNILADYLATNHRYKLYYHIPRYMMDWNWRKKNLIFELGLWSADIMCFQEVDRFQELKEELKVKGYDGVWKMRTGNPVDGCAVFWRSSRFKLLHEECIEFSKLGLRDNVAQICVLESLRQTLMEHNAALPASFYISSPRGSNKVVICNIHVLYNPRRGEIKIGQVRVLLDKARAVSKIWNDAPIVLCGDFNCTPKSPLYNFILEQKLDVSGVDRDKVSGQASAEINAPRSYNPTYRGHAQGSTIVEGKEDENKLNGLTFDLQNPNNSESSVEGAQLLNKESQLQCKNTRDVSGKSCINVHYGKDDSGHDAEANKDAKQNTVDISKIETESAFHAQGDGLKEDPSTSCGEGDFAVDNLNDEIHRSPDLSSDSEKVEVTEIECKDSVDFTSNANDDSNIHVKESMNCVRENDSSRQGSNSNYRDHFNSEIPLSDVSGQTSFAGNIEGQPLGSLGDLPSKPFSIVKEDTASSPYQVNTSGASTSVELEVQKNMENLSLTEFDEAVPEGEKTAEDDSTFLSALHNSGDAFTSDSSSNSPNNCLPASINEIEDGLSPGLDSETVGVEIAPYDPTLWTPMDIETATGNGECTLVEHPLKLRSTYTEVEDCTGTRDSNGEPLVTSYNKCFLGTVDYIWRSEGLQTVRVLAPIPKHAMQWTSGFPTRKWGSDHIALASEVVFVNSSNQS